MPATNEKPMIAEDLRTFRWRQSTVLRLFDKECDKISMTVMKIFGDSFRPHLRPTVCLKINEIEVCRI